MLRTVFRKPSGHGLFTIVAIYVVGLALLAAIWYLLGL
jgi:hypothetical protein